MRALFQGAGAIGIAGAALFTDAHDVAVVSRAGGARPHGVFPRRVSRLNPTDGASSEPETETVNRIAATRRVTVTDWPGARAAGPWDLIVLSTRPGELDPSVTSAVRETSPRFIAITSQVEGDLDRARAIFPAAEVVVFAPMFLSERRDANVPAPGRQVRYWAPAGLPRFLVAGPREAVRRLARELGCLVLPVPIAAAVVPPAVFIPYVAELSIHSGDWEQLKSHLQRPTQAAVEAVRSRIGLSLPMSAVIARGVLGVMERLIPIDVAVYAGRHFGRHQAQTTDMLTGWADEARESQALYAQISALTRGPAVP